MDKDELKSVLEKFNRQSTGVKYFVNFESGELLSCDAWNASKLLVLDDIVEFEYKDEIIKIETIDGLSNFRLTDLGPEY